MLKQKLGDFSPKNPKIVQQQRRQSQGPILSAQDAETPSYDV